MSFGIGFSKKVSSSSSSLSLNALSAGYDKTILVTKSGNDSDANGTANKPFLTIQAALNYASSNYTNLSESVLIIVSPGLYNENIVVSRYNTYIVSQLKRPEQRAVSIIGTVTINCSTANSKYNQVVGLEGLFISNSTTSPTVKLTGTAEHTTYIKECYLASNNTNVSASCLLADSTLTTTKSKLVIESTNFLGQKAGPDIVSIKGGEIQLDSNRILTPSITGAGNGLTQEGNSSVLCDRLQVDISTDGKCIQAGSTVATSDPTFYLSNSSLIVRGSSSAEVINTSRGLLLWNTIVTGKSTSVVKGVGASSYILYNNVSTLLYSFLPADILNFPSAAQKIKLPSI